jgi:hypothetical protein
MKWFEKNMRWACSRPKRIREKRQFPIRSPMQIVKITHNLGSIFIEPLCPKLVLQFIHVDLKNVHRCNNLSP